MRSEKRENDNLNAFDAVNDQLPANRLLAKEWHGAFTDHRVSGFHIRQGSPEWFVRIVPKGIHHA